MTLTTWRTFLVVCRLGSLSAAAAELGYTQSAVSRQVAALEREVGVPLLERRARGVVPTSGGQAFRDHARVVVTAADRARHAARDAATATGGLAIGATPSTAAGIVPAALRAVQESGTPTSWSLLTALTPELEELVATGRLDVAVVTDAPPGLAMDERLVRHPIGIDAMCVVVREDHPAASASVAVPLAHLSRETWVEDNEGSAALLRTAAARAGFEPRIDLAAADLTGKTAMVAAGHAVALVPGVLAPALRRDVVAVSLADPPTRGIYASLPAGATDAASPQAERLVAALERAVSEAQRHRRPSVEQRAQPRDAE
ncbi:MULTISPECIES: LysR family transcriptional regulator [Nocardioides]|uniref:LysR family transcriptional regulator n=1 Tax=Nocardioides vastitatis TaxID=2568655 RepID=A0ABW0ZGJ5_9ACTN|nr:LysR family transcriptional regulator [Nocardioides sp.]THJ15103.1 LysR family transcriptional regulator [Nocardioides sp.]